MTIICVSIQMLYVVSIDLSSEKYEKSVSHKLNFRF